MVVIGVVSLAVARVLPSVIVATLETWVVPAGKGELTATTKVALPLAPAASGSRGNVQLVLDTLALAQLHLAVLPAALKVVLGGTVSLIMTPVRPILPVFW